MVAFIAYFVKEHRLSVYVAQCRRTLESYERSLVLYAAVGVARQRVVDVYCRSAMYGAQVSVRVIVVYIV